MNFLRALPACAALLLTLAACAPTPAGVAQTGIDGTWSVQRFGWKGGGGFILFTRVYDTGGQTRICAAYVETEGAATYLNRQLLETLSARIGGERIHTNFSFATRIASRKDVEGARAACAATGIPWKRGYDGAEIEVFTTKRGFRG